MNQSFTTSKGGTVTYTKTGLIHKAAGITPVKTA